MPRVASLQRLCRPLKLRSNAYRPQFLPPSFLCYYSLHPKASYSSHRAVPASKRFGYGNGYLSRGILFAILLSAGGISYNVLNAEPLALDSHDSSRRPGEGEVEVNYLPTTPPMTMEQADEVLRYQETYHSVGGGSGVLLYHTAQLPSNFRCEDEHVSASIQDDGEIKGLMWGIYDGHAGWETSAALRDYLFDYIICELVSELGAIVLTGPPSDSGTQAIDKAIRKAFLDLDSDIMNQGAKAISGPTFLNDAMSQLMPAYAGSCALVSCYYSDAQLLKVACTGDSRAVLGRRNEAGQWEAIALSSDQTGSNQNEVARLGKEHPNEPELVKDGRILGLAVSRAFGDGRWKWSRELQQQAEKRFFGPQLREPLLTPPYLTAEPVITTTIIEPEKGDFLIMASDGLWDRLTNEQAVELVSKWLTSNDITKEVPPSNPAPTPNAIPPRWISARTNPNPTMAYTNMQTADERQFVVVDENAATHLVRNALGGGDEDMLCGMLTVHPPYARNLRDDITVHVVFFGKDDDTIQNF